MNDPNSLTEKQKADWKHYAWTPETCVDLHASGVHYFTPDYLPVEMDPYTYAAFLRQGLTPPMALPISAPSRAHISQFLDNNYYKLTQAGIQYLGNENNVQPASDWDRAKVRVCLCRLSPYKILDGGFGGHLVANFINDYTSADDIYIDFAYTPDVLDIPRLYEGGMPFMWGNASQQPLINFDIVIFATSYPGERINLPSAMVKSGLPLYHWERWDETLPYYRHCPVIALAGIGASFIENMLGDNPVHGPAGNSIADHVLIGEGELMDLKYIQQFLNTVRLQKGTKKDFLAALDNKHHQGVYDPTKFLFTYADKVHQLKDFKGTLLREDVYQGGGSIKEIFLVDPVERKLYSMAGPNSEEFQDMEAVNAQYRLRLFGETDPAELGRRYVRIDQRPTVQARKEAGFDPALTKEQKAVAADTLGKDKVALPRAE